MAAPAPTNPAKPTSPPNAFHQPNTRIPPSAVYILTLTLTPSISTPMNQLRTQWFPKHLNHTPAHITLFHALPSTHLATILSDLSATTSSTRPYHVSTGRPFRMRRGVGVGLDNGGESSEALREALQERWVDVLSAQDRGAWVPHWTVMNKVEDKGEVERSFGTVRRTLFEEGLRGRAVGVTLWRYVPGGRWEEERGFEFGGEQERETGGFMTKRRGGEGKTENPEVVRRFEKGLMGAWKAVKGRTETRWKRETGRKKTSGKRDELVEGRSDA